MQRGMAIAEARRRSASGCLSRSVISVSRMERLKGLRAVKRMISGGRANGRCILVSRLAVLKGDTNSGVSGWSIPCAVTAAIALAPTLILSRRPLSESAIHSS